MRSINFDTVEAIEDGAGSNGLPAGLYVIQVTDMVDVPNKEYVEVVYDIYEGEYKDFYADEWGKKNPWAHRFIMSYKDSEMALRFLKGRLQAFTESNPGFDALQAFSAQRLDMFKGRVVAIDLREEEYKNNEGEIKVRKSVSQVRSVLKLRNNEMKHQDKKLLPESERGTQAQAATPDYSNITVPFN